MLPRRKRKFMGVQITMLHRIKPEYRFGNEREEMVFIEIRRHRKYGAIAELYLNVDMYKMMWKDVSSKERERMQKKLGKIKDKYIGKHKRVDTSKWVKPDKESIVNELIKNLFLLEILDNEENEWHVAMGRASVLYSILNSTSPKNPQSLTSFALSEYFSTILDIMKVPESKKNLQIAFPHYGKGPKSEWYKKMRETEEGRKMYQDWKKKCLTNMIVKGDAYHHITIKEENQNADKIR